MSTILKGKPIADSILEDAKTRTLALNEKGIEPTLAIVRLGRREDDITYENNIKKKAELVGIKVAVYELPMNILQKDLEKTVKALDSDAKIHGIILFRPFPDEIDSEKVTNLLSAEKDVDGITSASTAALFGGKGDFFPPCTAQSCIELMKYYGIEMSGRHAVVIGRSPVIGRPVSMLLMNEDATVTICNRKTTDIREITKKADIIIACLGRMKLVDDTFFSAGQSVIDVGIHFDEEGKMCGDVDFEKAEPKVAAITPVPGGVGAVTTAILMKHVVEAAERSNNGN